MIYIDLCTDENVICECVMACWDSMDEDGSDKDLWKPKPKSQWLQILVNDKLAGVYELEQWSGSVIQVHVNIKPEFRIKYSLDIGIEINKWLVDNIIPQFKTFVVFIPECFPNVIKWYARLGWELQGTIPDGYKRGGQHNNVIMLTLPRKRMSEANERNEGTDT